MTTTTALNVAETYPHFADAFETQEVASLPSLRKSREQGWKAFLDLGLPTARRGNEPWKYTNVAPIAREQFGFAPNLSATDANISREGLREMVPWQDEWHTLVLVDGVFCSELSSDVKAPGTNGDVVIADLPNAVRARDGLGDSLLGGLADVDEDGFAALNASFVRDGAGISVPAGKNAGVVNIVYLTTGRHQPRATYPRTLVSAEANSKVTLIESFVGPDDVRYLTNAVTEIYVREGAAVEHYRILLEGRDAYHVGISRVEQEKDSRFSSVAIADGAALGRNDCAVKLSGTGAECTLNGLYLTKDNQHIDNYINIDHAEPYGTSRLFYKGILDGRSRAVFGGNVTVRKDAQKTDAQQTDKNLLLSPDAEIDSKPSLLIFADDVKCGHGATAGHIDADTVFYMRSRGLDLATTSRILIHAFASEIIDTVQLEPLRDFLDRRFEDAIPDADLSLSIGGL